MTAQSDANKSLEPAENKSLAPAENKSLTPGEDKAEKPAETKAAKEHVCLGACDDACVKLRLAFHRDDRDKDGKRVSLLPGQVACYPRGQAEQLLGTGTVRKA